MFAKSANLLRLLPRLRRFARALLGDPGQADAAVEMAISEILRLSGKLGDESDLYRALLSRIYDIGERFDHERAGTTGPPGGSTVSRMDGVENHLAALPAAERAALVLASTERFDYATIAEIIGANEAGVRVHLAQARERLRLVMHGEAPAPDEGGQHGRAASAY